MNIEAANEVSSTVESLDISVAGWAALARYLETQLDESKARLARILHDELGGVLVAAKMDLGHLERALSGQAPELTARATQAQQGLDHAIGMGRNLVETLQPGLLVHIGLIAAVRWYLGTLRMAHEPPIRVTLPPDEVSVPPLRRNVLYRAIQEAASYVCGATSGPVCVVISVCGEDLTARFGSFTPDPQALSAPRLLAIRHRVLSLGGKTELRTDDYGEGRSTELVIRAPLAAPVL